MRKNKDKNIKENGPLGQATSNEQTGNLETPALTDTADAASDAASTEAANGESKPAVADSHARVYVDNEGEPLDKDDDDADAEDTKGTADNDTITDEDEYDDDEDDKDEVKFDEDGKLDLSRVFRAIKKYWWMIALNCIIVGVIAALLIVEEPRTYQSSVSLAPEAEMAPAGGSLASLASSFGVDIGSISSSDAIRPDLYPDLVSSSDFILDLFKLPVKTLNGNVFTDYYTYLKKYQRSSWWKKDMREFMKKFKDKPNDPKAMAGKDVSVGGTDSKGQVKLLSYEEQSIMDGM